MCVQLSLSVHAWGHRSVSVCVCVTRCAQLWAGMSARVCAGRTLCISLCQELNHLLPISDSGGGGGDSRCLVDPLPSLQVSNLEACDCGHWCHCESVLPPSYLCLSLGFQGHGVRV